VLAPDLEVITPIRDEGVKRDAAIAYLAARNLPIPEKARVFSINCGLWGTTWGGGWTHDTWAGPPAALLDPPTDAPAPSELVLTWERGLPIALNNRPLQGPDLVSALGDLTARFTSVRPPSASKAESVSRPAPHSC
jgi:argininosuccinate synthase